jgi:hypothetical protein
MICISHEDLEGIEIELLLIKYFKCGNRKVFVCSSFWLDLGTNQITYALRILYFKDLNLGFFDARGPGQRMNLNKVIL